MLIVGFSQIKDINGDNDKILNKFFNPRFKTIDKKAENLTCNSSKKTHQEINIHSETNIPLWNNRDNFNNQFGSNTFRSRKKQYVIKEGPYQVDQDKLDKVFKKSK